MSLILIGLLINKIEIDQLCYPFLFHIKDIFTLLTQSIGIAIFVANIFTFHLGTKEFFNYVEEMLLKIIVSKEFIGRLDPKDKKELLKLILPLLKFINIFDF